MCSSEPSIFGDSHCRRAAQLPRVPRDQIEHRLRVVWQGGDGPQHFDAGGLPGDQTVVLGVAFLLHRYVGQGADQPCDPPASVTLDRGLIAHPAIVAAGHSGTVGELRAVRVAFEIGDPGGAIAGLVVLVYRLHGALYGPFVWLVAEQIEQRRGEVKFIARRQPFVVCHIERTSNELEQVARDAIAVASGALRLSRRCDRHVFPRSWPRPYCAVHQRIRRLATAGRCFKPSPALQPQRRKSDIAISVRVCYNSDAAGNRDFPLPRAAASWTAGSLRSARAPNLLAKWDVGLISQKCDAADR